MSIPQYVKPTIIKRACAEAFIDPDTGLPNIRVSKEAIQFLNVAVDAMLSNGALCAHENKRTTIYARDMGIFPGVRDMMALVGAEDPDGEVSDEPETTDVQ